MIDIDKMVEVVAENIVKVGKDRLYDPQYDTAWAGKIPDDVLHERKMKLARIYAKAAIKAFCKELPTMRNLIAMAKALIAIDDTSAIPNPMIVRGLLDQKSFDMGYNAAMSQIRKILEGEQK